MQSGASRPTTCPNTGTWHSWHEARPYLKRRGLISIDAQRDVSIRETDQGEITLLGKFNKFRRRTNTRSTDKNKLLNN